MNLKNCVLGIEFGSTRIKAVMLDQNRKPIAQGSYGWENKLVDGVWTYDIEEVYKGMRECYADLKKNFEAEYNITLTEVGAIGISGMMHGFLPFNKDMNLLTRFRTWRNTITARAAEILSNEFGFNIPQRWSVAHLYEDVLDQKSYINDIDFFTTLAGYIHYLLTGEKVMGIGEASGMFPIDSKSFNYYKEFTEKFDNLTANYNVNWKIEDILPKVLVAGENAGCLTEEGAKLLDVSGELKAGIPFAPPEGDAGTGMVATNSVRANTGNVSAGTSIFAMVVTEEMPKMHREIDMVTTPSGLPVAMAHCNNCTSDINGWVKLFAEFYEAMGQKVDIGEIYTSLFKIALNGDNDCGGLLSYNYLSGEGITDLDEGVPVFLRVADAKFNLANFMRTHIYSAFATLKIGIDLLLEEGVKIDKLYGHGGLFKTPEVAQRFLSSAMNTPVTTMETAGEGGPYGMALLAAYLLDKENMSLEDYLDDKIFASAISSEIMAKSEEIEGFNKFLEFYKQSFIVEKSAVESVK